MAQFMDHDMTFDLQSRLGVPTDPEDSPNERTPNFDLDTVYGGGPARSPDLYDHGERGDHRRRGIKFRIESGGLFEDLPRARDNSAIIGDPRNDENLMIAGLHAAFLLFHNNAVDWSPSATLAPMRKRFFGKRAASPRGITSGSSCTKFFRSSSAKRWSTRSCRAAVSSTSPEPHSFQSSFRVLPTVSAIPWCGPLIGRTSLETTVPRSSDSSSIRRGTAPRTPLICAAAHARRGALSVGRHSSISATVK